MFNLTTSFILVMNVTLLQNFQPGALQCTKTRGEIWKFSNPCALLPIFHFPSQNIQVWQWAWLLRRDVHGIEGWPDLWKGGGGLHSVWNSSNMQPSGAHLLAGARRVLPLIRAFSNINLNFFWKTKQSLFFCCKRYLEIKSLSLAWWPPAYGSYPSS